VHICAGKGRSNWDVLPYDEYVCMKREKERIKCVCLLKCLCACVSECVCIKVSVCGSECVCIKVSV